MSLCSRICTLEAKAITQPIHLHVLHRLIIGAISIPQINFAFLPCSEPFGTVSSVTPHKIFFIRKESTCHALTLQTHSTLPPSNPSLKISLLVTKKWKLNLEGYFLLYPAWEKNSFKQHALFLLVLNRESREWMEKAGTLALLNMHCWAVSLGGTLTIISLAITPLSVKNVSAIVWEAGRFQGLIKWPWEAALSFLDSIEFNVCVPPQYFGNFWSAG